MITNMWQLRQAVGDKKQVGKVVSVRHGPMETYGYTSQGKNWVHLESSIFKSLLNII